VSDQRGDSFAGHVRSMPCQAECSLGRLKRRQQQLSADKRNDHRQNAGISSIPLDVCGGSANRRWQSGGGSNNLKLALAGKMARRRIFSQLRCFHHSCCRQFCSSLYLLAMPPCASMA